jgi:hypothetical protein
VIVLDEDVLAFVRASIRSTWALELLLLLRRHAPQAFTADELVRDLRASPTLIATCLDQLEGAGVVARDAGRNWRYAPASPPLFALIDKLEAAYAERPVALISVIVGSPNDRLRSFSDAFRFPKKGD